jgi:membrane protein
MGLRDAVASSRLVRTAGAIVHVLRDRQLTLAAAGVAYHAFNALLPVLVLAVLAASRSDLVADVTELLGNRAGAGGTEVAVVASAIRESEGFWPLAALAGGVATWSAFQLGRAIASVFEVVYGDVEHSLLERTADVVVVFLTWVVALGFALVLSVLLVAVRPVLAVAVVWPAVLFAGLLAAFLPLYLVFPPDVSLREALPGAALAAGVWTGSGLVLSAYASQATSVQFFGVVGVALLVLTWLYLGSLALVAGAATNAVLTDRLADTRS